MGGKGVKESIDSKTARGIRQEGGIRTGVEVIEGKGKGEVPEVLLREEGEHQIQTGNEGILRRQEPNRSFLLKLHESL